MVNGEEKVIKTQHKIGINGRIELEEHKIYWKGQYEAGDTRIFVGGKLLCVISGLQKEDFVEELNQLINKYRI